MNALEAMASLPGRNKDWKVPPMPEMIRRLGEETAIYIFNVGPRAWTVPQGTLGTFVIPGCPEGADVSEPLKIPGIYGQTISVDYEGTLARKDDLEGRILAQEIVGFGPFKSKSDDLRRFGVFIAAGKVPSQDELDTAHAARDAEDARLVQQADGFYEINGGMDEQGRMSNITRNHIEAAKRLGIDRPWCRKNLRMKACEECGTGNVPTAAICKSCDSILNEELARKRYPQRFANEVEKRGPGRPRAEA